jgi:hypothetical protein
MDENPPNLLLRELSPCLLMLTDLVIKVSIVCKIHDNYQKLIILYEGIFITDNIRVPRRVM